MKKLYLSNRDIEKSVHDTVNSMYAANWRPDYIVGITRGGLIPAVMMSHLTGIKMHTLDVRLRDWEKQAGRKGKNILIVDDINDTGATFQWIKEDWPSGCLPDNARWEEVWGNNVRFATVVNNLSSEFDVQYSSIEVNKAEEDTWVVFPYEEWW